MYDDILVSCHSVTLENIPDVDAEPETFQEHYELFKNMTSYVDGKYTDNSSRTFIGKGSESGIVLMALFHERGPGGRACPGFYSAGECSLCKNRC